MMRVVESIASGVKRPVLALSLTTDQLTEVTEPLWSQFSPVKEIKVLWSMSY